MSETLTSEQWQDISRRLREPFDPRFVGFRVQGKERDGKSQAVAYIDARAVQDRLDAVVGAGNWSFDWTPAVVANGEVMVAKGVLTVYGISKADAGSASNFEQSLGAVSHCFKRAAVHWGIGRYLYDLPMAWVPVERGGRISEGVLNQLRARLPRPAGTPAPRAERAEQAEPVREEAQPAPERAAQSARPQAQAPQAPQPSRVTGPQASSEQMEKIRRLSGALRKVAPATLTAQEAVQLLAQLSAEYNAIRKAAGNASATRATA